MNKYLKYGQGEIKINSSGQKMYEITDVVNAWIKKEKISGGQLTIFIMHLANKDTSSVESGAKHNHR